MDTVDAKTRSQIMARVKSSGNRSTERALIDVMRKNHIKGWRRNYRLYGSPDFVFPKFRVAVFVDGCFWHGHPTRCRIPATNRDYWIAKIERNKARDQKVTRVLEEKGWNVVRIWEHLVRHPDTMRRLKSAMTNDES